MTKRPRTVSWGVLRRPPQTPRATRRSESGAPRNLWSTLLDLVLGEIDR